jgi:hypothetical protein
MNARGLLTTLVVCSLALAVHGCAIAPWEQQERPVQGIPPPVIIVQKVREHVQPEEKAELTNSRASKLPKTLEPTLPRRQQLPAEPPSALRPKSEPTDRRWIDPDAESGHGREAAQEMTLQPGPPPADSLAAPASPAPEPAQEPAPEPAQADYVKEPILEAAPSEALEPSSPKPSAPEQAGESALLLQPSLAASAANPVAPSALRALPALLSIFSPEPISEKPATLFLPDTQRTGWFDEAFEHGRPEESKIPRLLREPLPPPSRSESEP